MAKIQNDIIDYLKKNTIWQTPNIESQPYPNNQIYKQIGYAFVNTILQNNLVDSNLLPIVKDKTKPPIQDFVGKFCLNQNVLENIETLKNTNSQQLFEIGRLQDQMNANRMQQATTINILTRNNATSLQNKTLTLQVEKLELQNTALTLQNKKLELQNTALTLQTDIQSQDTAYKCMTVNVFGGNTQTITNLGDLFDWLSPIDLIRYIPKNTYIENKVNKIVTLTQLDLISIFSMGRIFTRDTKFEYYFINNFNFNDTKHHMHDILLITFRNADVQRIVVKLINNVSVGGTNFRHMSIRKRLYTQKNASVARWKC